MSSTAAAIQPFVCGGLSACIASSFVHPLDLAKVRLQLLPTSNKKPSFVTLLSSMVREEGFRSIYAGLSAAWMRQAVYGTARIGLFRTFSDMLIERNQGKPLSFAAKIGSGMLAGSIAVMLGTPCDVALVRMQGDSMKSPSKRRGYKNAVDALIRVAREEGVAVLYSGLAPNILRGMSMNAGMLACYDQAKEVICERLGDDPSHASLNSRLLASTVAGFTASFFSLPFDLVKSRLQYGGAYKGLADVTYSILTKEGPLAFWTGFLPYYMRVAPHAMILLVVSDPITSAYVRVFRSSEKK